MLWLKRNGRAAPVFAFPDPHAEEFIRMLESGGVPAFRSVESCADTISLLLRGCSPTPKIDATLPRVVTNLIEGAASGMLNEVEAGEVFAALGVNRPAQVVLATEAPVDTGSSGFPMVAKLVSEDLPHKTEMGAIQVGLESLEEVVEAITTMKASVAVKKPDAHIDGILVQEMIKGLGEALIGVTRDPLIGPIVTVAAGGLITEIYKDASVRPAPVSIETAREMVNEVKAFALLRGYRGKPKGDIEALARTIVAVSTLATCPDVEEAEINPVLVRPEGKGIILLDALIRKA